MSSENIYSIYLITNLVNDKKYVGYTSNKLGQSKILSVKNINKYVDNLLCDNHKN